MKTINRIYPIFVALFLLPFICVTASAEMAQGTETRITNSLSDQYDPVICGDMLLWSDYTEGYKNIFMYNLTTSTETQITHNESYQEYPDIYSPVPDIYADRAVWVDYRNSNVDPWNTDIYMYNISTSTESQITTDGSFQSNPVIYGDNIVWEDRRSGPDIYMYNVSTLTETRINGDGDQYFPAIYDDKIVRLYSRNGNMDIYLYNISTHQETQITNDEYDQYDISIYGDMIVWADPSYGSWDIYMYNLSTSRKTQITTDTASQRNPDIFEDKIVWEDGRNLNGDIYMYDLSTSTEIQITNNGQSHNPAISNDRIVWYDYRNGNQDVYMFTLAPAVELTPLDRTNDLKNYVENTLSCNVWTKKALIKPVDTSIRFLEKGKDSKAVVSLKSFIDLVKDMKKHKKISAAEADYMIKEARGIIDQIKVH